MLPRCIALAAFTLTRESSLVCFPLEARQPGIDIRIEQHFVQGCAVIHEALIGAHFFVQLPAETHKLRVLLLFEIIEGSGSAHYEYYLFPKLQNFFGPGVTKSVVSGMHRI
jgi:hypothetical protein|tara:strand:- start:3243 stop:3575 length:333 start_codon:yes stop_codon:yes gene_type:complete